MTPSCTALDGQVFDLAGTPYSIAEAELRLSVVTDLAADDFAPSTYERRAADLLIAIITAKRQARQPQEIAA